jgi:hypothetical protein
VRLEAIFKDYTGKNACATKEELMHLFFNESSLREGSDKDTTKGGNMGQKENVIMGLVLHFFASLFFLFRLLVIPR